MSQVCYCPNLINQKLVSAKGFPAHELRLTLAFKHGLKHYMDRTSPRFLCGLIDSNNQPQTVRLSFQESPCTHSDKICAMQYGDWPTNPDSQLWLFRSLRWELPPIQRSFQS